MRQNFKRGFAPIAIVIVVLVTLALGGGVYYSAKNSAQITKDNSATESPTPSVTPSITPEFGVDADAQASLELDVKTGTLRGLLALGKDMVCTFDSGTASNRTLGTMYLSGSMMRGDFSSGATNGTSVESHMIKQGDNMFVWSGSQGAKMSIGEMDANTSSQNTGAVNLDQNVNYKCENWRKDDAKFSAPSDVNFIDLGAMMKASGNVNIPTGI